MGRVAAVFPCAQPGRRPGLSIQNVLWGWNVLSRLSPSKRKQSRPAAMQQVATGLGSAAASGLPRPGREPCPHTARWPPRTDGCTFTCQSRVRGSHAGREDSGHGRDGAARGRLGAPNHDQETIATDRSGSEYCELSRRARSLCTVRLPTVRGLGIDRPPHFFTVAAPLPLLDGVSWYQVTVSGLAS